MIRTVLCENDLQFPGTFMVPEDDKLIFVGFANFVR